MMSEKQPLKAPRLIIHHTVGDDLLIRGDEIALQQFRNAIDEAIREGRSFFFFRESDHEDMIQIDREENS